MNQEAWDNGVEVKRLRAELWKERASKRRVVASRDRWRRKYFDLWCNWRTYSKEGTR